MAKLSVIPSNTGVYVTTPGGHAVRLYVEFEQMETSVCVQFGSIKVERESQTQNDFPLITAAMQTMDDLLDNLQAFVPELKQETW